MAIGMLAVCYNNPWVFTGVVKIRKGQAVEMIMGSTNKNSIKQILAQYTLQVCAINLLCHADLEPRWVVKPLSCMLPGFITGCYATGQPTIIS